MAGVHSVLYSQTFTSSASISVTHNLGFGNWELRVIVDAEMRNDLVDSVVPDVADPLNLVTVNLSSASTGRIQLVSTDITTSSYLGPDLIQQLANGPRIYPHSATDPVTPAPSAGDLYYNTTLQKEMRYDGSRSKWLSTEVAIFQFGRSGNTGANTFYRGINGSTLSNVRGWPALYNGTVIGLAYTRSDTDAATFEITEASTTIASLASSAVSGVDTTLDGDFSAGSVLSARNAAGSNATNAVQAWCHVKWRA